MVCHRKIKDIRETRKKNIGGISKEHTGNILKIVRRSPVVQMEIKDVHTKDEEIIRFQKQTQIKKTCICFSNVHQRVSVVVQMKTKEHC